MTGAIDKVVSATDSFVGCQVIYGYFAQAWLWRFRLHVFLKPDPSEAMHDHAWPYVSIPLVSYVEETLAGRNVVRAFRLNRRPATHVHRYLGKWSGKGTETVPGLVPTVCLTGRGGRPWHYWRVHRGVLRSYPWKPYLRRISNKPSLGSV